MKKNILLVVVDCMRRDYAYQKMPRLQAWSKDKFIFKNHWATSHCTDPTMTHMLTGKHPDEIGLYSMMYEDTTYTIPDGVELIAQAAARCGYHTGMLSGNGRWYARGQEQYVDTYQRTGREIVAWAGEMMRSMPQPWFITVHLVDMHKAYQGGTYQAAADYEDQMLKSLLETAPMCGDVNILVTADHGEALGEHDISGHGYGLWDCITHIPMVVADGERVGTTNTLTDSGTVHEILRGWMIGDKLRVRRDKKYVYQVGVTSNRQVLYWHYGVVYPDKAQYILCRYEDKQVTICVPDEESIIGKDPDPITVFRNRNALYGPELFGMDNNLPTDVEQRLKDLGYFE